MSTSTAAVRLLKYLKSIRMAEREFNRLVGWSNGSLSKAVKEGRAVQSDRLEKVFRAFPDLDAQWVLTGQGSMEKVGEGPTTMEETAGEQVTVVDRIVTVADDGRPNIVMLDRHAAADLHYHHNDPNFFRNKPAFHIPGRFMGEGILAIQIAEDSMSPTIRYDDWVLVRRVFDPFNNVEEGQIHVLITREGATARRLYRAPRGRFAFVCKSDNPRCTSKEIAAPPGLAVYKVLALLTERLPKAAG